MTKSKRKKHGKRLFILIAAVLMIILGTIGAGAYYKSDFCHELDEYNKAYKKLIELFPDGHIPKLSKLKAELEKARTDYAQQSAERKVLKKEADRLSRLAQQKRDSQKTIQRYLQNEQAAKRKKNQLE